MSVADSTPGLIRIVMIRIQQFLHGSEGIAIAAVVEAMLQLMIKVAQMNDWFPAACQSIVAGNAGLYPFICTITLASRKLIAL